MNVLLLNTYAESGGASVAAQRLCAALNEANVSARLLVQNMENARQHADVRQTEDAFLAWRPLWDALPVLPWRNRRSPHWGTAWVQNFPARLAVRDEAPDIVHLHWINHGFLSISDVARLPGPLVWTLHDSWAFTGGCHSPQDCRRFVHGCGACPELRSQRKRDLSRWTFHRKKKAWRNLNLTVITPSRWLADNVEASLLLGWHRIEVIPNVIPTDIFKPLDREMARRQVGLPVDQPLFLFAGHGAMNDWNKGGDLWRATLETIAGTLPGAAAVVAGREMQVGATPLTVHQLGALDPEHMALALNAVDALVLPSRMENLPNIAAESLACGAPVAAFAVGGIPEMIETGRTGYLAEPFNADDLAYGIVQLIGASGTYREQCLHAAQRYAPEVVAKQHLRLYEELVEQSCTHPA